MGTYLYSVDGPRLFADGEDLPGEGDGWYDTPAKLPAAEKEKEPDADVWISANGRTLFDGATKQDVAAFASVELGHDFDLRQYRGDAGLHRLKAEVKELSEVLSDAG